MVELDTDLWSVICDPLLICAVDALKRARGRDCLQMR